MKPDEASRTALMIARQRAAHQLLDHGSILDDPFAIKILGEDEKAVLQFANSHPLAAIGRLFTAVRSRIAEDALSAAVENGTRQVVILGAGLDTFALRYGNVSNWPRLNSRFRHGSSSCPSISSGTIWEKGLPAPDFSGTRPRFSPGLASCRI